MTKNKLLLVSLKEDEAKQIAQVLSNDTSRKILDLLAESEATETEIAQKLNLPLSTTHYNMQQLMKSNLVVADEFHYSPRGKEVNHYKLANQYIIIAPKGASMYGIKEKLKSILPVGFITLIGAGLIHLYTKLFIGSGVANYIQPQLMAAPLASSAADATSEIAKRAIEPAVESVAAVAKEAAISKVAATFAENASLAAGSLADTASNITQPVVDQAIQNTTQVVSQVSSNFSNVNPSEPNYALWFLIGGLTVMVFMVIIEIIRARRFKGETP